MAAGIAGAASIIGGAMDSGPSAESQSSADAWQLPSAVPIPATNPRAEYNLLQSQLGDVQPGTLGTQPRVPTSTTYAAKPALGVEGVKGGWLEPDFEKPTVTNPFSKSSGIIVDPETPDAAAWEQRYGGSEIAETIAGASVAVSDLRNNWNASVDYLYNHDIPAIKKRAGELYDNATSWNVWDPPAISLFTRPVVTATPVAPLKYTGGGVGGW